MERNSSERAETPRGDGHADQTLTSREFDSLASVIEELERQVIRNRQDIDMQFQRLADLQAVIDRMQISAKRGRSKTQRRRE